MKRARGEQLQTAVLFYLKKRNFTDSECTFRNNFKFEHSLPEAGARAYIETRCSVLDTVAMTTQSLSDYFLSFKALQDFVGKAAQDEQYRCLNKLLFPIFLHAYLDLVIAGRQGEAEEFYYLYSDDESFKQHNEVLVQLQKVKDFNDLSNYFAIAEIRNKFCKVGLSFDEKQLLLRFIHGQDNLLVMKIINERLRLDDDNEDLVELSKRDDAECKDRNIPTVKDTIEQKVSVAKSSASYTTNTDPVPMIISPPSLTLTNIPACTNLTQTPEKPPFQPTIDPAVVKKHIKNLRETNPVVQNMCLYKFDDGQNVITSATISNNRMLICCGKEDSRITLWNVCQCNLFSQNTEVNIDERSEQIPCVSYPDVSHVSFGNDFKDDVLQRSQDLSANHQQELYKQRVTSLQGHSGPIYSSCFTHDDKYLLTCSEDTTIRLWDLKDLKNKVIYKGHNHPVWCLSMSALSMYFASGSLDCTARLWSLDRTFPLRLYAGHEHSVEALAFHDNASYLATADHTVRLWDVNSGKTVRLMVGHWAPVTSLSFSPNGKMLASSGEDCRIRIWDIASGSLVKEIRSHTDTVYSLSFSPDNSMIASGGADRSLYVWNISSSLPAVASDAFNNASSHPHLVAHWAFEKSIDKILSVKFCGDMLDCIAVV